MKSEKFEGQFAGGGSRRAAGGSRVELNEFAEDNRKTRQAFQK
jgi:hypothetical protein